MSTSERGVLAQQHFVKFDNGIYWASVYWVNGSMPKGSKAYNEVSDPPNSGWSSCFVIDPDPEAKTVKLFCPYTFDSYTVSRHSMEYQSLKPRIFVRLFHGENFPQLWMEIRNRGWTKDFETAGHVMRSLGYTPPEAGEHRPPKGVSTGGKKASADLSKPVKRSGRKGQVLALLIDKPSISHVTDELGIDRKNVLSQLFLLKKDHGIGYSLSGDDVDITMPDGVDDPFGGNS